MSSSQQCSSGIGRRGIRSGGTRRMWSKAEEDVLVSAIRELIAQGWKLDNGFRAGYLNRLEEAMKKNFPNTDLKGNPHINSKIHAWKKLYYSLCSILNRSGVGFNARGNFMLDVEDDTWAIILKVDPTARTMRFKQWIYYDVWCEIFGRDRATGYAAEDLDEACNDLTGEASSQYAVPGDLPNRVDDEFPPDDDAETSRSRGGNMAGSTTSREKKRKLSRDIHEVCAFLDRIGRNADMRLDKLAGRFGYDFELEKKKTEAFKKLECMDFLSVDQRFAVCDLLSKEVDKLQVFRALSDAMLPSYVDHLLRYLNQ